MKIIITFLAFLLFSLEGTAQIGATKSSIILEHKNYEIEVTDDGTEYIIFIIEYDNYNREVICYLTDKVADKEQICYRVLIVEPSSETNNWIKSLNDQNFVKLDGMVWKDYENSIVYEVKVKDGNCLVIKYYDTKL